MVATLPRTEKTHAQASAPPRRNRARLPLPLAAASCQGQGLSWRGVTYAPALEVKEGAASIADYFWAGERVAKRVYPNGIRLEAFYDGAKRATTWANKDALGADVSSFQYAYDKAHNRKYEARVHDAKGDVYRYDGIYELTGVRYGVPIADLDPTKVYTDYLTFDREQTFEFDGVGNRKTMVDGAVTTEYNRPAGGGAYTPDPVNRIYRTRESGVDTNRVHDANGNLTNDGIRTYTYNYKNEQIEVHAVSGGALVESANYNCFGIRITRTASPPEYYITDGARVVEVRDSTDAVAATYVFGPWIDEVLTMTRAGATYYYSQQALFSVVHISDASGNNVEKIQYDPFGRPSYFHWLPGPIVSTWVAVTASLIGNPFAFTGREWSSATASYYFRARYMDPQHGRFFARDRGRRKCPPFILDQYNYVENMPTVLVDPSGLDPDADETEVAVETREVNEGGVTVGMHSSVVVSCKGMPTLRCEIAGTSSSSGGSSENETDKEARKSYAPIDEDYLSKPPASNSDWKNRFKVNCKRGKSKCDTYYCLWEAMRKAQLSGYNAALDNSNTFVQALLWKCGCELVPGQAGLEDTSCISILDSDDWDPFHPEMVTRPKGAIGWDRRKKEIRDLWGGWEHKWGSVNPAGPARPK